MLTFHVRSEDLSGGRWVRDAAGGWRNGASRIAPFPHPALDSLLCDEGRRQVIGVREAVRGRPRWSGLPVDRVADLLREWPGDHLAMVINCGPAGAEVSISVGRWGSAPVYLHAGETHLYGSWDPAAIPFRPTMDALEPSSVVESLTLTGGYGPRTLWRGLTMLPERGSAVWRSGSANLRIIEPRPAEHHLPRTVRTDADVLRAYGALVSEAVHTREVNPDNGVVEVSGGTDSATVALAMGDIAPGVASYGLLVGGVAGAQQVRRRTCITSAARTVDHAVDAGLHPPLRPSDAGPSVRRLPGEEPYSDAVLAALAATTRPRLVVTGIGGDELYAVRPDERPVAGEPAVPEAAAVLTRDARDVLDAGRTADPGWPITDVAGSALRACAARAPTFLRQNCWPVAPLCSPALTRFAEWLPADWRYGKAVARQWLLSCGLPPDVVWPRLRENFRPVMQRGLRRHGVPALASMLGQDGLALVDLGYVDADRLRAVVRRACGSDAGMRPIPTYLYEVLAVERAVRAWVGPLCD